MQALCQSTHTNTQADPTPGVFTPNALNHQLQLEAPKLSRQACSGLPKAQTHQKQMPRHSRSFNSHVRLATLPYSCCCLNLVGCEVCSGSSTRQLKLSRPPYVLLTDAAAHEKTTPNIRHSAQARTSTPVLNATGDIHQPSMQSLERTTTTPRPHGHGSASSNTPPGCTQQLQSRGQGHKHTSQCSQHTPTSDDDCHTHSVTGGSCCADATRNTLKLCYIACSRG